MTDGKGVSVESTADLVGSPPGRLPEELGGEAALVGHRESEDDSLPEHGVPHGHHAHAEQTAEDDEPKPHRTRRK